MQRERGGVRLSGIIYCIESEKGVKKDAEGHTRLYGVLFLLDHVQAAYLII